MWSVIMLLVLLGWTLFSKSTGTHHDIPKDIKWLIKFVLVHGYVGVLIFFMMYSSFVYDFNDYTQACASMSIVSMYVVVSLMYFLMVCYQDDVKEIVSVIKNDYTEAVNVTPEERAPVELNVARGVWFLKLWISLLTVNCSVFVIQPIIKMIYYYIIEDFRLIELHKITYPTFWENIKMYPIPYLITNISFVFLAVYIPSIYISVVPLGPIFMLHACGQLEMMQVRVMRLFPKEGLSSEERHEKLKQIIEQSHKVYSFVSTVQKCFMMLYEIILKGSSIIIPVFMFIVFQDLKNRTVNMVFVSLLVSTICICLLPCYYGDMLIEQGNRLRQSLYMCGWEAHWDRRARTTVLLLLTRMQKTLALRSVFRDINLETLTDVYRQAYAIFNFFLTAWT